MREVRCRRCAKSWTVGCVSRVICLSKLPMGIFRSCDGSNCCSTSSVQFLRYNERSMPKVSGIISELGGDVEFNAGR